MRMFTALSARTVSVADPFDAGIHYRFPATSRRARKRALKLATKEPGTIKWLHENLRADDVFYDIGANVGVYTLFAAARVPRGRVLSFEPHAANFAALLQAIELNAMGDVITPICIALDAECGYGDFRYRDTLTGSTGSQIISSPIAERYPSRVTELKHFASVDALIEHGVVPPASLIKIDVDGNEANILRGMRALLMGNCPPRQIQVEVDPRARDEVFGLMREAGYVESARHLSVKGEQVTHAAADPEAYPFNVIFAPQPPA